MLIQEGVSWINKKQVIAVINQMLYYVDPRLVCHGERVAYIVSEMLKHAQTSLPVKYEKLLILSLLHDIGAFKTEEIDEMVSFESGPVWSHSIYGYLFLKHMSPIGDEAESLLYHHLDYKDYNKSDSIFLDYSALIYLADRIDILCATSHGDCNFDCIRQAAGVRFAPEYVELFFQSRPEQIARRLRDGSYREELLKLLGDLDLTLEEAFEYLKMMVFSVDFRSEYTVTHTVNTTAISVELGKRMGLSRVEQEKLYLGALLHDVGKVAISTDILEFQGRLTLEQMEIMKEHARFTEKIITGLVDEEVVRIATRHHEKLDGTGYPMGLSDRDLTVLEKIVAVADIISALTSRRSYKDAFSKEKTLGILSQMEREGQLYPPACEEMIRDYDEIMHATDVSRDPIISIYDKMHSQYFELNEKVQKLLEDLGKQALH